MAEERNTGLARAPEPQIETDATKIELQRRMEEARESITQTVAEIKETVSNQYQQVRETISDSLDWREQYRRRPVAFSVGALGAGLLLGYSVGGVFSGGGRDDDYDEDTEDTDASIRASSLGALAPERSYAAQAITGGAHAPAAPIQYAAASAAPARDAGPDSRQVYGVGYAQEFVEDESDRPGLIQRVRDSGVIEKFKETKAYDRLQQEVGALGDRFVDELSTTARNVVLPALLGKLKDFIGIDLSTQREVAQRSRLEHEASRESARTKAVSDDADASGQPGGGAASAGGYSPS